MTIKRLKSAAKTSASDAPEVRETVLRIIDDIDQGGEDAARRYAEKFDGVTGDPVLSAAAVAACADEVSDELKDVSALPATISAALPRRKGTACANSPASRLPA